MQVFPAQAGVILSFLWHFIASLRLSRASGGDPSLYTVIVLHQWSFPRKRG